jgi:hypothetical protein
MVKLSVAQQRYLCVTRVMYFRFLFKQENK